MLDPQEIELECQHWTITVTMTILDEEVQSGINETMAWVMSHLVRTISLAFVYIYPTLISTTPVTLMYPKMRDNSILSCDEFALCSRCLIFSCPFSDTDEESKGTQAPWLGRVSCQHIVPHGIFGWLLGVQRPPMRFCPVLGLQYILKLNKTIFLIFLTCFAVNCHLFSSEITTISLGRKAEATLLFYKCCTIALMVCDFFQGYPSSHTTVL